MKYMVEYTIRHAGKTNVQSRDDTQALITAFSKWKPDAGLSIHAFVSKLDGRGGYILLEAGDPKLVASFAAKFVSWNDSVIVPVMEVADAVSIGEAARAWVSSALSG